MNSPVRRLCPFFVHQIRICDDPKVNEVGLDSRDAGTVWFAFCNRCDEKEQNRRALRVISKKLLIPSKLVVRKCLALEAFCGFSDIAWRVTLACPDCENITTFPFRVLSVGLPESSYVLVNYRPSSLARIEGDVEGPFDLYDKDSHVDLLKYDNNAVME